MELKKVILIVALIAGLLSVADHFVGGLKFSGFRHARLMKTGLDRDLKIAGGKWHMERTDRADSVDAEIPATPEVPVEVAVVPVETEKTIEAAKKAGYDFQTSVKAMPMPKADGKTAKKEKKKKKKKKTQIARTSTDLQATPSSPTSESSATTGKPTSNLNPVAASQLNEFLQNQQRGTGPSTADQVYGELFQFGGNLQSIAKLFEMYQAKRIEPAVFFAVIERVMTSPNVQFRMFAVQGLKGIVRPESFERLAALMGVETDQAVIANLGGALSMYANAQNIQMVEPSLKSVNPSARYHALTTIKSAMQATGSQTVTAGVTPSRDVRGSGTPSSVTSTTSVVQKFQLLAQAVRQMQTTESEKRIAALANETYYSIHEFVQSRRVAASGTP